jgi:hypothetical protein
MKDCVCLHFHIFKNAGTTIEWILKKNFSKNAISVDKNDPQGLLHFDDVIEIMEKKQQIKSISSHQFRFPIYENKNYEFIPIVFFRHPIDRVISIYHFQRKRTDAIRPGITKAKELDLSGYIEWNLKTKNLMAMKNFQVLYLSDKSVNSKVDENDYKNALQRMKYSPIIGVVDKFDVSLVIAEEYLRKKFPKIDLSYRSQNVSFERKGTLEERLEESLDVIDKKILENLMEQNHFDLMLYEEAKNELNRRKFKVDNFQNKYKNFLKRCDSV